MACNLALAGLVKDCEPSKGGIRKVWFVDFDKATPAVTDGQISGVTVAESGKFSGYYLRKNTATLTSTRTRDDASGTNFITNDLTIQFARWETTKRMEVEALSQNDLAAIVKDANGKYWYLGYDEPLCANGGASQLGQSATDANMYQITMQSMENALPYEIPEAVVETLVDSL